MEHFAGFKTFAGEKDYYLWVTEFPTRAQTQWTFARKTFADQYRQRFKVIRNALEPWLKLDDLFLHRKIDLHAIISV